MSVSAVRTSTPPPVAPDVAAARSGGPPPPTTDDPRAELARDRAEVARSETAPARSRTSDAAVDGAARAYLHQGGRGVREYLRTHPREMAELARMTESELSGRMQSSIARQDRGTRLPIVATVSDALGAQSATGAVVAELEQVARNRVRQTAVAQLDEMIGALAHESPEAALRALRAAPPGSPVARLAGSMGLRGDDGDLALVTEQREDVLDVLRELRGTLMGGAWDPGELPASRDMVARALGVAGASGSSIAGRALDTPRADVTHAVGTLETAVEVSETFAGAAEIAEGVVHGESAAVAAGAAEAGAAGVGIAWALYAEHVAHESSLERYELALALGL